MLWLTDVRSALGRRLTRRRKKGSGVEILKKAGKEVGMTLEVEANEIANSSLQLLRWMRHNPIKVLVGITVAILFLL